MMRTLVGLSVGVALLVGTTLYAQQTGTTGAKDSGTSGTDAKYLTGKIVRVDPQTGVVVIRTGTGTEAKEQQYRVGKNTRFYGDNNKEVTEGLKYSGWRPGADVRYQLGTGANNQEISGLWVGTGTGSTTPPNKR